MACMFTFDPRYLRKSNSNQIFSRTHRTKYRYDHYRKWRILDVGEIVQCFWMGFGEEDYIGGKIGQNGVLRDYEGTQFGIYA